MKMIFESQCPLGTFLGPILLSFHGEKLQRVELFNPESESSDQCMTLRKHPVTSWFESYFKGESRPIPMDWIAINIFCSKFQLATLNGLMEVPLGQVSTYSQLATAIQRPKSQQAIGNALHQNPCPIIIPCHRIVLKSGGIGGFAWGAKLKQALLEHETKMV
jgi:O-6-methylguanine DNA methyltransferase